MSGDDALDRGTRERRTSPADRGTTDPRTEDRGQLGVEGGVDLGGTWDEYGNYWYTEETGLTWLWREPQKTWEVFSTPDDVIRTQGSTVGTGIKRALASQAAAGAERPSVQPTQYSQFAAGIGTRWGQRHGVVLGIGAAPVAEGAAFVAEKGALVLGMANPWAMVAHPPLEAVRRKFREPLNQWDEEAEQRERESADMRAEARGDFERYQLPVVVAGTTKQVGGRGGPPADVKTRVDNFVKETMRVYRTAVERAKTANPKATRSAIGRIAEKAALADAEGRARACGLDPAYIHVGDVPVGVTGPKGGASTTEVVSWRYKFMLELKLTPDSDRGRPQLDSHRIAVEESVNFERGGRYFKGYGEGYEGEGVETFKMGEPMNTEVEVEVP
jgi:hypothetical protein